MWIPHFYVLTLDLGVNSDSTLNLTLVVSKGPIRVDLSLIVTSELPIGLRTSLTTGPSKESPTTKGGPLLQFRSEKRI